MQRHVSIAWSLVEACAWLRSSSSAPLAAAWSVGSMSFSKNAASARLRNVIGRDQADGHASFSGRLHADADSGSGLWAAERSGWGRKSGLPEGQKQRSSQREGQAQAWQQHLRQLSPPGTRGRPDSSPASTWGGDDASFFGDGDGGVAANLNRTISLQFATRSKPANVLACIRKHATYLNALNISAAMKRLVVIMSKEQQKSRSGGSGCEADNSQENGATASFFGSQDSDAYTNSSASTSNLSSSTDTAVSTSSASGSGRNSSSSGSSSSNGGNSSSNSLHSIQLDAALALLTRITQLRIDDFEARQLSNCCWAAAKLASMGATHPDNTAPLISLLLQRASSDGALRGVTALELWLLAWAAMTSGVRSPALANAIAAAALTIPLESYQQEHYLTSILALVAQCNTPQPQLFSTFGKHLLKTGMISLMTAHHLYQLVSACASADHRDPALVTAMAARAGQQLQQYTPNRLCHLVSSLSALQYRDQPGELDQGLYKRAAAQIQLVLDGSHQAGSLVGPHHVARLWLHQSIARLESGAGIWDANAAWSRSLLRASVPLLLQCNTGHMQAKAVLTFSAELCVGEQPEQAVGPLLSAMAVLTPQLATHGHQVWTLDRRVLLPLVHSLPRVISCVQPYLRTPAAETPLMDGGNPALLDSEPRGSGMQVVSAYAAAVRAAAVSMLADFSDEERKPVSRALLEAADRAAQAVAPLASVAGPRPAAAVTGLEAVA